MDETYEAIEARAAALEDFVTDLVRDLIEMRTKHGLSQAEVAARMGISQPAVAQFERYDANPTLGSVKRYALAVGARINHAVVDDWAMQGATSLPNVVAMSFKPRRRPSRAAIFAPPAVNPATLAG